jgi:hypothetical protein
MSHSENPVSKLLQIIGPVRGSISITLKLISDIYITGTCPPL